MTLQTGEYLSSDGRRLRYRQWEEGANPDALVYLHGIESHSGWFSECAHLIERMNVSVYALDRRGSGLNEETRGDCRDFRQLAEDVIKFVDSIRDAHDRIHLAALSWGGKLAVATDMLHPGIFSTVSLVSPGFFPRVTPRSCERISIAVDWIIRPHALHAIPIKDEMFTSIPTHLEYIANDPLRLHRVTASFYRESVRLDRFLKNRGYQWTAPTQALLAESDAIVDTRKTRRMLESLNAEPKRIRIYTGCNHSLQFEKPGEVAQDIVEWMQIGRRENTAQ
jgi:acylglycerol lipase